MYRPTLYSYLTNAYYAIVARNEVKILVSGSLLRLPHVPDQSPWLNVMGRCLEIKDKTRKPFDFCTHLAALYAALGVCDARIESATELHHPIIKTELFCLHRERKQGAETIEE